MERNNVGYCELCPKGFISYGEGKCVPCPSGSIPNYGIFLTNWDSLPPGIELKKACEFLSAEIPNECPVNPSWISYGNRLESATTRMRVENVSHVLLGNILIKRISNKLVMISKQRECGGFKLSDEQLD
uniref:Tyrosine-protein kinase ephrin type A/B receptor-like domain-containing protein n=1 Tax=Meloidogyne javanica TaxID=6303 RepID=A0A915MC90_MELJA